VEIKELVMARWGFNSVDYSTGIYPVGETGINASDVPINIAYTNSLDSRYFSDINNFGHIYTSVNFSDLGATPSFPSETLGGWSDPLTITDVSSVLPSIFTPLELRQGSGGYTFCTSSGAVGENAFSGFFFPFTDDIGESFSICLSLGEWFNPVESGSGWTYPSENYSNGITLYVVNSTSNSGYGFEIKGIYDSSSNFVTRLTLFELDSGEKVYEKNLNIPAPAPLLNSPHWFESNTIDEWVIPPPGSSNPGTAPLNLVLSYDSNKNLDLSITRGATNIYEEIGSESSSLLSFQNSRHDRSTLNAVSVVLDGSNDEWVPSVRSVIVTDKAHPVIDHNNPDFYTDAYKLDSNQFDAEYYIDPVDYSLEKIVHTRFVNYNNGERFTEGGRWLSPVLFEEQKQGLIAVLDLNDVAPESYAPIEITVTPDLSEYYIGSVDDATPVVRGFVFYQESDTTGSYGFASNGFTDSFQSVPRDFTAEFLITEVGATSWNLQISMASLDSYGEGFGININETNAYMYYRNTDSSIVSLSEVDHYFDGVGSVIFSYIDGVMSLTLISTGATPFNETILTFPYRNHSYNIKGLGAVFSDIKISDINIDGYIGSLSNQKDQYGTPIDNSFANLIKITSLSEQIMQFSPNIEITLFNLNKVISEFVQIANDEPGLDTALLLDNLDGIRNNFDFNGQGDAYDLKSFTDFSDMSNGSIAATTNGDGAQDPLSIQDLAEIAPSIYQDATIANNLYKPIYGQTYSSTGIVIPVSIGSSIGDIETFSIGLGGFSGNFPITIASQEQPHIELFLTPDLSPGGYFLRITVLNDIAVGANSFYTKFVFCKQELDEFDEPYFVDIAICEMPYVPVAEDIVTISHEIYVDSSNATPISYPLIKCYFNNFLIGSYYDVNSTIVNIDNFGILLRRNDLIGSEATPINYSIVPSVKWISWSDIFYDPDPLGYSRYLYLYNIFQEELKRKNIQISLHGPNIMLETSGTAFDTNYNGVSVDSRIIEFLNKWITDTGNSIFERDGISIMGNFSDLDWSNIVEYIKDTILDNSGEPIIIDMKDSESTPIEYPSLLENVLSVSDTGLWPGHIKFFEEFTNVESKLWYFRGNIKLYTEVFNVKVNTDVLSTCLTKNGTTPNIEIYDGANLIYSDSLPFAGNSFIIDSLGETDLEKSYSFIISGTPGEKGNGNLRITFSADEISPVSISDNIVVISK